MADTKISALSAVSAAALANEFAVNEAGTTKKVSGTQLSALFGYKAYLDGRDFGLASSDVNDQTSELEDAIAAASSAQQGLFIPGGRYLYTGPLAMPSNCHIIGEGGTSFRTRLVAKQSSGLYYDGTADFIFHSSLTDVMLEHEGSGGAYLVRLDKCYSLRFKNVRFVRDSNTVSDAALVIENSHSAPSLDILFDNIIMQFGGSGGSVQGIGVRLADRCGNIRFIKPDIEACLRLMKWEGGKIEVVMPYMETAGVNAFDLTPNSADTGACFKVFGGEVSYATDAIGAAIRANCHDVDFFGTKMYGASTAQDVYVYSTSGVARVNFWGMALDYSKIGGDVGNPLQVLGIYGRRLLGSKTHDWGSIAAGASESTTVTVTGATLGSHTALAHMSISAGGLVLFAEVSSANTVTVTAFNPTVGAINLASTTLYVTVNSAPIA